MEVRRLVTQAIKSYTGQRPDSVEFYEDPNVEGTIAVRADGADYLVHYGIPGHDFVVEEARHLRNPVPSPAEQLDLPAHHRGAPSSAERCG